jgi:hypothetical protein
LHPYDLAPAEFDTGFLRCLPETQVEAPPIDDKAAPARPAQEFIGIWPDWWIAPPTANPKAGPRDGGILQ